MFGYKAGDVLLNCKPLLAVVKDEFKGNICDHCNQEGRITISCQRCYQMFYCNVNCLKKDWRKVHQYKECSLYAIGHRQDSKLLRSYHARYLLRLLLIMIAKPKLLTIQFKLYDGSSKSLLELKTHEEDFVRSSSHQEIWTDLVDTFKKLGLTIDTKKIFSLYCMLCINSFDSKSVALYVEATAFNHSCQPNAEIIENNRAISVRAIKSIKANEPIAISYIDLRFGREERQLMLENQYFFECKCSKCESDFDDKVDYDQVRSITEQLGANYANFDGLINIFNDGLKMLSVQKRISGKNHTQYINLIVRLFAIKCSLMRHGLDGDQSFDSNKMRNYIKILFSKNEADYKKYMEMIDSYEAMNKLRIRNNQLKLKSK